MASTIQVRVDDELKLKFYGKMTEEEMFARLETSREHVKQGKYRKADEVVSDMREKYGL